MRSRFVSLLAILALAVAAGFWGSHASADPATVQQGAQRAVFAKGGTRLAPRPSPIGKAVKQLAYGTRVRVEEVRGRYLRVVEIVDGSPSGATGWVKATQTVEPYALTQGGQRPSLARARATGARIRQGDVAAAGRQFSPKTEAGLRAASRAELRQAYMLLDSVVEVVKPTVDEVEAFVAEGGLGGPEGRQAPGTGSGP